MLRECGVSCAARRRGPQGWRWKACAARRSRGKAAKPDSAKPTHVGSSPRRLSCIARQRPLHFLHFYAAIYPIPSILIDGTDLRIDASNLRIDASNLQIDGSNFIIDGSNFIINGINFVIDGSNLPSSAEMAAKPAGRSLSNASRKTPRA